MNTKKILLEDSEYTYLPFSKEFRAKPGNVSTDMKKV
jgi:hypothetical protein